MAAVKLADLDKNLQTKYAYDPAKTAAIERARQLSAAALLPQAGGSDSESSSNNPALRIVRITKSYRVPGSGVLELEFPATWHDELRNSDPSSPHSITVRFDSRFSPDFVVFFSTLPTSSSMSHMDTKSAMEIPGRQAIRFAVEKELNLETLDGVEAKGHYFTMTEAKWVDRTPPRDHFKYQTQGMAKIGDLSFDFVVLSNFKNAMDTSMAMEMVKNARFKPQP
jgi:hypothetical protein